MRDILKPSTQCVHHGSNRKDPYHSITSPVVHSAPCPFPTTKHLREFMDKKSARTQPEYGRMGNPTLTAVQNKLAGLDGGEQALLFASGMATITTTLFVLLEKGDHVIITNDSYHKTRDFVTNVLAKFGVQSSVVEPSIRSIKSAIRKKTKIIFSESPTNPYLYVLNVEEIAKLGRKNKIITIIDSSFATPINQRPLEFGIDLVIHAATKYIGGHNDIVAGALVGSEKYVQPIADMLRMLGGICDPNTAFLLERGIKTLALRMKRHNESAQMVAEFLEGHPKVEKVYYPGLISHPCHELATAQMDGFGGVVSFFVKSDLEGTLKFIDRLSIPYIAPSFGGPESLVDPMALMSFWDTPKKDREKVGIYDNLVRYAMGLEDPEDIIDDLKKALARL